MSLGGGSPMPQPQALPQVPMKDPAALKAQTEAAFQEEQARLNSGRASDILTSPLGVSGRRPGAAKQAASQYLGSS